MTAEITDLSEFKKLRHLEQQANQQKAIKEAGEPTSNFFRVSHLSTGHKSFNKLSIFAKLLFYTLCKSRNRYQRGKMYFTRSDRQLEKEIGISRPTITKAKKELKEALLIVYAVRPGGRTRYSILDVGKAQERVK